MNKHKLGKSFKQQGFSGKTTENGEEFLSSFNNYYTLNNIDKQEKRLIFEMCLCGAAR